MTEKQMRKVLHRIWSHFYGLSRAMNDAHNMGLIKYDSYQDGPCAALEVVKSRVQLTTQAQIAEIIQEQIKVEVRDY